MTEVVDFVLRVEITIQARIFKVWVIIHTLLLSALYLIGTINFRSKIVRALHE